MDECTLPTSKRPLRLREFDEFFTSVLAITRPQPTRLDLVVPRDVESAGRDLAARESDCCSFFTFEFEPAADDVVMRITVPADHVEVLDAIEARVGTAD
jgi:hypothetical protein